MRICLTMGKEMGESRITIVSAATLVGRGKYAERCECGHQSYDQHQGGKVVEQIPKWWTAANIAPIT